MENIDINNRVYEIGYLLIPTLSEEEIPKIYGDLKELTISLGGEIISDEMPKMLNLAYTMSKVVQNVKNKFNTAYFGWIKFLMDCDKTLELKKKLDADPKIIRFLFIKTVKENTIAAKRFASRDTVHRRIPLISKEGESKESVSINKEEIDKEIEAMVGN